MKFDPTNWQEVKPNETYQAKTSRLFVMCSQQAALYVSAEGVEALAGVGASIDVNTAKPTTFKIDAPAKARCFIYEPTRLGYEPQGEVFTNTDRQPMESGTMLEITKALRQFKLEIAQQKRMLAEETRKLKRPKPDKVEPEEPEEAEEMKPEGEAEEPKQKEQAE